MTPDLPGKHFSIENGQFSMNALPTTQDFVTAETTYLASHLSEIRGLLKSSGPVTMIHSAQDAMFACRMDDVELGQVTSGEGCLMDAGAAKFTTILSKLRTQAAH